VVRFEEPPTEAENTPTVDGPSEDEGSLSFSEADLSDASATTSIRKRRKRTRRAPRNVTNFLLAQAPPRLGTKKRLLHLRPRILLQLQQLSQDKRPKPSIDVVPSSFIAGTLIAPLLARRFPRIFRIKGELGLNDVILVKSEDYDASNRSGEDSDDECLEKRELVAIVSPVPRKEDEAEMVLCDGSVWTASRMANGSYEFVHVDEAGHTVTARWVKRSTVGTSATTATTMNTPTCPNAPDYMFKFSLINPLSRRHPIMATLTPCTLEILDHYTTISASSGRYPPSKPFPTEVSGGTPERTPSLPISPSCERSTVPVDEATKTLITVSAVWISLRSGQGWPTVNNNNRLSSSSHMRSVSSGDRTQPSTTPMDVTPAATRLPMGPRQTTAPMQPTRTESPPQAPVPRRTLSSGAAFMQRRRERAVTVAAVVAPESEAEDVKDSTELGYGPVQSHGRFYRKLRALKDLLTGRRRDPHEGNNIVY
jgi:hypothetical protein